MGETAGEVGFATTQHFASVFRAETGMTPTAYARRTLERHRGEKDCTPR